MSLSIMNPGKKYGGFLKLGVSYWGGPHNKDYSILGSILGSPYLGKLPNGLESKGTLGFRVWGLGVWGLGFGV